MALTGRWKVIACLMISWNGSTRPFARQRATRCSRTSSRSPVAAEAYEAIDQIDAVAGPLLVSLVLVASGDYRTAFACLAILSSLMIAALMTAC